MLRHTAVTVTKEALIIRIPWSEVVHVFGKGKKRRALTVQDAVDLVRGGRREHKRGKTRPVSSLNDLA